MKTFLKLTQPELGFDIRPREITTDSREEFLALCDRAEAGELVIEGMKIGAGNGQWICRVRWPKGIV